MVLVGRDRELTTVEELLAREPGAADVLEVEGEPGIGKTTVCREAAGLAAARGYRTLSSVASEAETQVSFTGLRDLLESAHGEIEHELPEPRRRALAVALLREESRGPPPDAGSIAVGLLTALRLLATHSPVLVLLDDVQWLDAPSAHALRYAIRRTREDDVLFLVARRPGHGDDLGLAALDPGRVVSLRLGALTIGAFGRVLRSRHGASYPRPLLRRLHEVAGGNPLFGLELAAALGDARRPLRPGEPLPVPDTLHALLRDRFAALPTPTADALAVAAALSRPTVSMLGRALERDPLPLLEAAATAGLLELDGGAIRFAHPLFAASAYDRVAPSRRREIHRRLAAVGDDVEERARHVALASIGPDEEAAALLDAAARAAAERGASLAAAELFEEAHGLTPEDDGGRRAARALDAGWFQFIVGDASRSRALLEEASETAPPGPLRARALTRLGWLEHHAGDRRVAVDRYRAALDETDDPHQQAETHSLLAWSFSITRRDAAAAARHARHAVDLCDAGVDDPVLLVDALSVLAQSEFFLGGGLPSPAMERALAVPASGLELRVLRRPTNHWALMLLCADRFEEARPLFEEVRRSAVDRGDESAVPWPLMRLSQLELAVGHWRQALLLADEGLETAVQTGQAPVRADLTCTRGLVLAHLGRAEEARHTSETGLELTEASGSGIGARLAGWALGMLDLSLGRADEAAARLRPLWQRSTQAGIVEPGENRYLGDLGEALVLVGDVDGAERLAGELDGLGERLRRDSVRGTARRISGLAAVARGEHERAVADVTSAVAAHERAGVPFELGRSLLSLGSVERRARHRRDARASLQRALAIFDALGAELWAERTRGELGRIGGRAPSPNGLTPTEKRVADLVAEGKSNKEVAAALVVSVHTVESALTSIYRKLDVRSRTELARRLADGTVKE